MYVYIVNYDMIMYNYILISVDNIVELQAINDEYTMWTIIRTDRFVCNTNFIKNGLYY